MASTPLGFTSAEATAQLAQMSPMQKWQLAVEVNEQAEDPLQYVEGKSKSSFVIAATPSAMDEGQIVNIRIRSGFYAEGKKGTELFESDADFEKRKGISYQVIFGPHRHGSSYQRGVAAKQAIEADLKNGTPEELGKWIGRKKWEEAAMTLRERTPAVNTMAANGRSLSTLGSADIFDRNNIIVGNGLMKRYGGGTANAGKLFNGQIKMRTIAIAPSTALTRLKLDPAYQLAVREAAAAGANNPLFTGEVVDIDNCVVREHNGLDHDGDGPLGSPLEPRGVTSAAIAAGTTAFDVTFGENTSGIMYSKWFPGYNYTFTQGDTLASPAITLLGSPTYIHAGDLPNISTGGEHYLMIINPPVAGSAGEPANGIGYYAYTTGNNGNKITITRRLGSTISGVKDTTLGHSTAPNYANSVVWGAGTWGGRTLTDVHPAGSIVLPCNIRGVPIGWVPIMGGGGLMRAYGTVRNNRGTETAEAGFLTKVFIESDFGHRIRIDRLGRSPGVVLMVVALGDPSLPLPVVA